MSAIPSLTILSEEQKFNGDNLLQWNTYITQLLGAKGLLGYINGKILKPSESQPPTTVTTVTSTTPIYSTTPTPDEWTFRDQVARGHITLNCTDVASLGVITTGTAKDAYNSIQNEWGKSTDMRRSHAQEALNRTEYAEGTDILDHIKLLRTRKAAVDNLSSSTMSDETWRGIIIRSIPPTVNWLPVIPSLYTMATSADIISTLSAHGMILARYTTTDIGASSSNTALAAQTTNSDSESEGCTNPNCKAKIRSTHTTANCYWPGGGKEGQFPPNFGTRSRASVATSNPEQTGHHFALSARLWTTPGHSGILISTLTEPDLDNTINDGHHIKRELDITDISDAPRRSTFHCMSASVGEQLLTPLTAVTEPEPITGTLPIHETHFTGTTILLGNTDTADITVDHHHDHNIEPGTVNISDITDDHLHQPTITEDPTIHNLRLNHPSHCDYYHTPTRYHDVTQNGPRYSRPTGIMIPGTSSIHSAYLQEYPPAPPSPPIEYDGITNLKNLKDRRLGNRDEDKKSKEESDEGNYNSLDEMAGCHVSSLQFLVQSRFRPKEQTPWAWQLYSRARMYGSRMLT